VTTNPIVVGVDGSLTSLHAVDLAAREANLRRRPLHVVHAFTRPYLNAAMVHSSLGPVEGGLRFRAECIVAEAVVRAGEAAPAAVRGEVVTGTAATVLREYSRTAAAVAIGYRGLGGFTGLLLGSVAAQLAAHATVPVLVARGSAEPSAPVLLGVDGSPAGDPAVGFAFEEADLRRAPLVALHAWTHPVSDASGDMAPLTCEDADVEAQRARLLAEALAGWQIKYPDVVVRQELVRREARRALVEATHGAQLAVVGSRGGGGFALLGSVSEAVLHHAACPVAVVPAIGSRTGGPGLVAIAPVG
jgi:nucleotide-binding universal stress UspA family protein